MSATFWNMRRRKAAMLKEQERLKAEQTVENTQPATKKVEKKTTKKAVQANDNTTD